MEGIDFGLLKVTLCGCICMCTLKILTLASPCSLASEVDTDAQVYIAPKKQHTHTISLFHLGFLCTGYLLFFLTTSCCKVEYTWVRMCVDEFSHHILHHQHSVSAQVSDSELYIRQNPPCTELHQPLDCYKCSRATYACTKCTQTHTFFRSRSRKCQP